MHVITRINNNVVLVSDNGRRMIVIGKGLGFKAYPGDHVPKQQIQQRYILQGDDNEAYFIELLKSTPPEMLSLAKRIVDTASDELKTNLPANLVFTLADHIGFTTERLRSGMTISHPLTWEIRQFFPAEYRAGIDAVSILSRALNIQVPEAEASFLAMHFVNALGGLGTRYDAVDLANTLIEIVSIVENHYGQPVNQGSISFSRFITHLRYCLAGRMECEISHNDSANEELLQIVSKKYPDAFTCAHKIIAYLAKTRSKPTSSDDNELLYLTLHVNRLATSQGKEEANG